jgi:hypothetical protein
LLERRGKEMNKAKQLTTKEEKPTINDDENTKNTK